MAPRISVIIPVYNGAAYLGAAIESVLGQSRPPTEIIVVDDGSTDGSAAVAARFGNQVRAIFQEHGGIGAARNTGVRAAGGDFLAFLDADDLWMPDKLALQLEVFATNPDVDLVFGAARQFMDPALPQRRGAMAGPAPAYLAGAMLARRDAFLRAGLFSAEWVVGEFVEWYLRAEDLGLKSLMRPECVLLRRIHTSNQGIREFDARIQYVRIVREALNRRRARERDGGS